MKTAFLVGVILIFIALIFPNTPTAHTSNSQCTDDYEQCITKCDYSETHEQCIIDCDMSFDSCAELEEKNTNNLNK